MVNKLLTILILLLFLNSNSYSQILKGFVYDENKNPLVGVNIFLLNSNIGTTSNLDGHFLIKLNSGYNQIIFSYIGFVSDTLKLSLGNNETISQNVLLKQSYIQMPEVIVKASDLNEAERIIKKVIDNKNNYLNNLKNYSYDAYTKTVLLVPTEDSVRYGGITQTLSKGYFESPDKFQEVILSKIQTKNITEAHNIFSIGKIPNILDEYLKFDDEKIISPLNINALYYYYYKIIDTTYISNVRIFNIEFYPQNRNLHLFSGKLSILDKKLVPIKVELFGEERIITKIRNKIEVKQQFREYENEFWLPTEVIYNSTIDMGIPSIPPIYFNQLSLISDYNINDATNSHIFDKYLLKQNIVSGSDSDSLWQSKQLLPLTTREQKEFLRIDSVISNAGIFTKLAVGLTQSLTSLNSLPFTNINDFYHYNRVEGNYLGLGFYSKNIFSPFVINTKVGYGLNDDKMKYYFSLKYQFNSVFIPFLEIFDRQVLVDKFYNYHPFDITYQSLFYKNDYADYYYSKGTTIGIENNIDDFFKTTLTFTQENQNDAYNNSNYSFFNKDKKFRDAFVIQSGKINSISLSINYDNQNYYDYGFVKAPDFSDDFTKIKLDYTYSSNLLKSDYTFHQLHLIFNNYQKINSLLNFNVNLKSGILLNDKINQYKFHLPGNYGTIGNSTLFRTILSDDFIGNNYLLLFFDNNFKNTLFNFLSIPFLKQSKYDFHCFYNLGMINNEPINKKIYYSEIGFGISNILSFFRFDFTIQLSKQKTNNFTFTIISSI
jgi:hypothetical protein